MCCILTGRKRLIEEKQLAEQEKLRNELRMEEIRKQELRNEELRMEEVRNERQRNQELARKEQQRGEPVTKMRRMARDEEPREGLNTQLHLHGIALSVLNCSS